MHINLSIIDIYYIHTPCANKHYIVILELSLLTQSELTDFHQPEDE